MRTAILKTVAILFLYHVSSSKSQPKFAYDLCTTLYTGLENNSTGFPLLNDQHISNVEETYQLISAGNWSSISSFSVTSGCTFTACNGTDFDGHCQTFQDSVSELPAEFDDVRSASCSCAKNCKCSDVYIRSTGCARAYLNKGCNTCHAYYMDLKGEKALASPDLLKNISSVMVRPGCTLTTYDEEGFEGEVVTTLDGITKEEWTGGPIASFECQCQSRSSPKPPKPRPGNYPEEIAIPSKLDEISKLTGQFGRHPGIMAALESYKNKRSPTNAYILLLGLTGAGKSSAINLLFDNPNLTKVGDGDSTTGDIHEFRIPVPLDELGITNSELRVIDTPGLGDTRGLERDARFLATLDDYLSSHEELSHRLPNVILVFGKFHDNRYCGKGSPFVKMLNGLDLFNDRITDKKHSNVIVVLSHFMSMTKDVTRSPTSRIRSFKKCIEEYSLLPKPISIVVAENKAEEQDLPMLNGYYRLPNGDFYPRNLFDKIQQMVTNSGDPIGEAIIRTAFRDSDDFNITSKSFELVRSDHGKALKYLGHLVDGILPVEDTEVSKALSEAYTGMNDELKRNYPDALRYIQRAFNLRNIRQIAQVPRTTLEIIQFLRNVKQNEANAYLMSAAFGLKAPSLKENLVTGFSYNVLEDKTLPISPIQLGESKVSDTGYMFPSSMSAEIQYETFDILKLFRNQKEYSENRLRSLGVEGSVPVENFVGKPHPGWNIVDMSKKVTGDNKTVHTMSAVRELRTFRLKLNDRYQLSPEFKKVVNELPAFNSTDHDNVDKWKAFFNTYGTHVVRSTYGGGSIEIEMTSEGEELNLEIAKGMFDLIQFAEDISTGQIVDGSNNTFLTTMTGKHALKFKGGDVKYHSADLTSMSLTAAVQLLENWKESVALSPTLLMTDVQLLPISQIAKKVSQNISSEIQRAAFLLLNSTLRYTPPSLSKTAAGYPLDRQDTEQISKSNEFASFMKVFLENQQKSDERFLEAIMQMQNASQEAERRRQVVAEEERQWERNQTLVREAYMQNLLKLEQERKAESEQQRLEWKEEMGRRNKQEQQAANQARLDAIRRAEEDHIKHLEYLRMIAEANRRHGGCLKKGTKILMVDGSEKAVELVKQDDWILDGNLNPTQVTSTSYEFLFNMSYFGFDGLSESFFTDTHLFVDVHSKLRVVSPQALYRVNPLMQYMDVEAMKSGLQVQQAILDGSGDYQVVASNLTEVYEGSALGQPTDYVYMLQVDNPEGTYFANGFMARHETPPFQHWPNTMAALFKGMEESNALEIIGNLDYTMENFVLIDELSDRVDERIRSVINAKCLNSTSSYSDVNSSHVKPLGDFDADIFFRKLFNNPCLVAFQLGIYGKTGKFTANHLDVGNVTCENVEEVQVEIAKVIVDVVQNFQ